jgi:hypothetical protein
MYFWFVVSITVGLATQAGVPRLPSGRLAIAKPKIVIINKPEIKRILFIATPKTACSFGVDAISWDSLGSKPEMSRTFGIT